MSSSSSSSSSSSNYQFNFNGINITTTVVKASWVVTSSLDELRSSTSSSLVGLDVEWKPNTSTSDNNPTATLQLCHGNRCIIIQLLHLDFIPNSLKAFLADESIRFVGVGITEDLIKLGRNYGVECRSGLELGPLAAMVYGKEKYKRFGLADLARDVVGLDIEKPSSVTRSDWSGRSLTTEQIKYATIDAYASFAIGNKLLGGNK